jgi:hypothetical protein
MQRTIHDAIAHHQQGRLPQAEAIYLELLRANANDAYALHYLGVVRMSQGKAQEARELVETPQAAGLLEDEIGGGGTRRQ